MFDDPSRIKHELDKRRSEGYYSWSWLFLNFSMQVYKKTRRVSVSRAVDSQHMSDILSCLFSYFIIER